MNKVKFTGIIPALVSPVNEDGSVRENSLRRVIDWQLSYGVSGIYVCGSTGEGLLMKPERRMELLEIAVSQVAGRVPVIAHTGAMDLDTAVALTKHAEGCGADAVSSIPPAYYRYREEEIIRYYTALADSTSLPLIAYAIELAQNSINAAMMKKLVQVDNIIGIKWTYHDYSELQRIKTINGGDINVINGPDECLICGLAMGADAGIGSTYNIMPGLFVKLFDSFAGGDIARARETQYIINSVIDILIQYGVINGVKEILDMLGFEIGYCIPPMRRLDREERLMFRQAVGFMDFERQCARPQI